LASRWFTKRAAILSGKEVPRGLVKKILKDVDLQVDEYLKRR